MANKAICSFNREWTDKTLNPLFSSWIKEVSTNRHQSHCSLCLKNFELSSMGRGAVTSHLKSSSHARNSGAANTSHNISSMLIKKETVVNPPVNEVRSNRWKQPQMNHRRCLPLLMRVPLRSSQATN